MLYLFTGDNNLMWGTTSEYLTNVISKAEFGTLDKVQGHPERNKAASKAAQAFVNSLAMALSTFQVGAKDGATSGNGQTVLTLQLLELTES